MLICSVLSFYFAKDSDTFLFSLFGIAQTLGGATSAKLSSNSSVLCLCFSSPPAVINSKILTVTVRPEPQPTEPMVVVELSPVLNVSKSRRIALFLFVLERYTTTAGHESFRCSAAVLYWGLENTNSPFLSCTLALSSGSIRKTSSFSK